MASPASSNEGCKKRQIAMRVSGPLEKKSGRTSVGSAQKQMLVHYALTASSTDMQVDEMDTLTEKTN